MFWILAGDIPGWSLPLPLVILELKGTFSITKFKLQSMSL
jgi:hypothetical protein